LPPLIRVGAGEDVERQRRLSKEAENGFDGSPAKHNVEKRPDEPELIAR
jgi:hypothetical protein